ncbi:PoNe immunity protein domain-containing protein [Paraburkholderia ferrariae]|uniref:Uncharacterized protein n=1 Tax=Paraburkholderia ferrariae TaxID=386056 RepID=A0ABU9RQ54_9BURK
MDEFSNRRRQRFISEQYFEWLSGVLTGSIDTWSNNLPANGTEDSKRAIAASLRANNRFALLLLRYTAGEPIAPLRSELDHIVADFEEYAKFQGREFESTNWPPFLLGELKDYERAMQLIGLCYLLVWEFERKA